MFTLKFDGSNNFDPVAKKHGNTDDRIDVAKNICWLLNNAQIAIEKAYGNGAPRRVHMLETCQNLREQLMSQLTDDENEELEKHLVRVYNYNKEIGLPEQQEFLQASNFKL